MGDVFITFTAATIGILLGISIAIFATILIFTMLAVGASLLLICVCCIVALVSFMGSAIWFLFHECCSFKKNSNNLRKVLPRQCKSLYKENK